MVHIRVTRSARKHRIGNAYILEALIDAGEPAVADDGALHYIGRDSRGIELHVVAVSDDRREGLAVIHAMPTEFRRKR